MEDGAVQVRGRTNWEGRKRAGVDDHGVRVTRQAVREDGSGVGVAGFVAWEGRQGVDNDG